MLKDRIAQCWKTKGSLARKVGGPIHDRWWASSSGLSCAVTTWQVWFLGLWAELQHWLASEKDRDQMMGLTWLDHGKVNQGPRKGFFKVVSDNKKNTKVSKTVWSLKHETGTGRPAWIYILHGWRPLQGKENGLWTWGILPQKCRSEANLRAANLWTPQSLWNEQDEISSVLLGRRASSPVKLNSDSRAKMSQLVGDGGRL